MRSDSEKFQGEMLGRFVAAADRLKEVAGDKGLSLVQLSIAWALRLPAITAVLVGAKTPAQVQEYAAGVGVPFNADELDRIEEILAEAPTIEASRASMRVRRYSEFGTEVMHRPAVSICLRL